MSRRSPALTGLVLLLGLGTFERCAGAPPTEVPEPPLEAAEARVREKITRLRRQLMATPGDGARWGRYGMALDAHGFVESARVAYGEAHTLDPQEFLWPYFLAALLDSSQPEVAVDWYHRALAVDAGYAPAHVRLAHTLQNLAQEEEAREHYLQATLHDPRNPFGSLGLGRIALRRGELETAVARLEQAYELNPRIHAVVASLAQAYHRAGRSHLARRRAAEARDLPRITYQPDSRRASIQNEAVDVGSYVRRAKTNLDVGQLRSALEEVREALALAPRSADVHFAAAEIYLRMEDFQATEKWARGGLELAPQRAGGHALLARALFGLARPKEALAAANRALEQDPADGNMHLLLGRLLAQSGTTDMAIKHLRHAVHTNPGNTEWRLLLAAVLVDSRRFSEAQDELSRLVEINPDHAAAWSEKGFLKLQRGDPAGAVQDFHRAAELGNAEALPGLIQALLRTAGRAAAVAHLEEKLRTRPDHTRARLILADLLATARRFEDSAQHLHRILEIEPDNPEAWIQLGYVRLATRQDSQAALAFKRALTLTADPGLQSTARQGLGRAQR